MLKILFSHFQFNSIQTLSIQWETLGSARIIFLLTDFVQILRVSF